jgi:hypothetical protein
MVMAVIRESVEEPPAEAGTARPVEQAPPHSEPATPAVAATAGATSDDLLGRKTSSLKSIADTSPWPVLNGTDKIADRVIQKLSAGPASHWEVVPEIATRVIREELKRSTHEG